MPPTMTPNPKYDGFDLWMCSPTSTRHVQISDEGHSPSRRAEFLQDYLAAGWKHPEVRRSKVAAPPLLDAVKALKARPTAYGGHMVVERKSWERLQRALALVEGKS